MCEPTTIAMGVMSIAGAAMSMATQAQQADAQNAAIQQNYEIQRQTLQKQQQQQAAQTTQQLSERARQAWREEAAAKVSAAESGVTGLSVLSLLDQTKFNAGYDSAYILKNQDNQNEQNKLGFANLAAQRDSAKNQVQQPDYFGGALQIGQAGLNAYDRHKVATDPSYKSFRN